MHGTRTGRECGCGAGGWLEEERVWRSPGCAMARGLPASHSHSHRPRAGRHRRAMHGAAGVLGPHKEARAAPAACLLRPLLLPTLTLRLELQLHPVPLLHGAHSLLQPPGRGERGGEGRGRTGRSSPGGGQ